MKFLKTPNFWSITLAALALLTSVFSAAFTFDQYLIARNEYNKELKKATEDARFVKKILSLINGEKYCSYHQQPEETLRIQRFGKEWILFFTRGRDLFDDSKPVFLKTQISNFSRDPRLPGALLFVETSTGISTGFYITDNSASSMTTYSYCTGPGGPQICGMVRRYLCKNLEK